MTKMLGQDAFLVGLGHLERFYRRNLKPFDREIYYEAVKRTTKEKWEKCIRYACMKSKTFPKPVELRDWLGLGEELTPAEEDHGFKAGTIRGYTPGDICAMAHHGQDLPFDEDCWADQSERLIYLDVVYADQPPIDENGRPNLDLDQRLAWIRKYSEKAEALYEEAKERIK